jgi:predicted dehydrogenase
MSRRILSVSRRRFLGGAAKAGAALAFPALVRSSALGADGAVPPSDRIGMGFIGVGGRVGIQVMPGFAGRRDVQVVAIADVYQPHRDRVKETLGKRKRPGALDFALYTDFRELLARPEIDAVVIGTPDHWHAVMTIMACRAGKDVYVEKPESHTLREGRLMVEAARRYGRVVSGGSQRVRGDSGRMADYVASGAIGEIREAFVGVGGPAAVRDLPAEPTPPNLDWELWLGPGPARPYHTDLYHNWRGHADYGTGSIGDWGAHRFGGALYALRLDETGPVEVVLNNPQRGQRTVTFVYANGMKVHHDNRGGEILIVGSTGEAKMVKDLPEVKESPLRQYKGGTKGRSDIDIDFLHCVRTRERPFRDIEYCHRAVSLVHLATIAYKIGRSFKWDPVKEAAVGDEAVNRLLDHPRREPWRV